MSALAQADRTAGGRTGVVRKPPRDPVKILLAILGILVFVFLFTPILVIVLYSFNNGRLLVAWNGFGLDAYTNAWQSPEVRHSVQVSMMAGVAASLSATTLGTIGGVALARWKSKLALVLTALLAFTLVTPEIIDAVSILPWFVYLGHDYGVTPFNNGLVRLIIVHTSVALATVTFIVRARMSGMDPAIEEAASDLYANSWNRFRQVTLPLARPAIMAGALMAFTLSLDNTIVSSFVALPGYTSWPVYIFSLVRVSPRPLVAAVSTVMFVFTLAVLALVYVVLRRGGEDVTEVMAGA